MPRRKPQECRMGPHKRIARAMFDWNDWRLLTRADLRHTPRVSAFFDFMIEEIDTLRPIITG